MTAQNSKIGNFYVACQLCKHRMIQPRSSERKLTFHCTQCGHSTYNPALLLGVKNQITRIIPPDADNPYNAWLK